MLQQLQINNNNNNDDYSMTSRRAVKGKSDDFTVRSRVYWLERLVCTSSCTVCIECKSTILLQLPTYYSIQILPARTAIGILLLLLRVFPAAASYF